MITESVSQHDLAETLNQCLFFGVPLPFVSYGLSSLLVNFTVVGLLLSVAARKHRVMF